MTAILAQVKAKVEVLREGSRNMGGITHQLVV